MLALIAFCLLPSCSNDPTTLGDERLCWDASENATSYEVEAGAATVIVGGSETCLTIAGTSLVTSKEDAVVRVKACNEYGCSEASESVTFQPWTCLRSTGCVTFTIRGRTYTRCGGQEYPCYPGAPIRYPEIH